MPALPLRHLGPSSAQTVPGRLRSHHAREHWRQKHVPPALQRVALRPNAVDATRTPEASENGRSSGRKRSDRKALGESYIDQPVGLPPYGRIRPVDTGNLPVPHTDRLSHRVHRVRG